MEDKAPIRAILIVTLPNGETERHEIKGTQEVKDGYTEDSFPFPAETMYGQYEYRITRFERETFRVDSFRHFNCQGHSPVTTSD